MKGDIIRKLNLENYTISIPDEKGIPHFAPYEFQKTLEDMLSHRSLGLNGPELLRAMEVVEKINKVDKTGDGVTLTEDDYELIVNTCKKFRGFTKFDTQFLKRIFNCPAVADKGKIVEFSDNGKEKE